MEKGITVRVKNYEKFKGRSDVKNHLWFRCANDILEDEDFYDFESVEVLVWIYVLGRASKKKSAEVFINFERAERSARLKRKDVISAINKLSPNQLVILSGTESSRDPYVARTDDVRNPAATLQDGQDSTPEPSGSLPAVARIWNSITNSLPKIQKWNKARARAEKAFREKVSEEEWALACQKVEASEFLSGRSGKWAGANFDWLLNEKNVAKVLEGNYDNRGASANQSTICGIADV